MARLRFIFERLSGEAEGIELAAVTERTDLYAAALVRPEGNNAVNSAAGEGTWKTPAVMQAH